MRLKRIDYVLLLVLAALAVLGVFNLSQRALQEVAVVEEKRVRGLGLLHHVDQ